MKKKFALWICRILKVNLVEPIEPNAFINIRHEIVKYETVRCEIKIDEYELKRLSLSPEKLLMNELQKQLIGHIFNKSEFIQIETFRDEYNRCQVLRAKMFIGAINN